MHPHLDLEEVGKAAELPALVLPKACPETQMAGVWQLGRQLLRAAMPLQQQDLWTLLTLSVPQTVN
jgi:hypothetical protein